MLRKINKTGDVQRDPGNDGPGTVHVPDNISKAEDLIMSQNNDMLFINRKLNMRK